MASLAPLDRVPGAPHWLTGSESRAEVQRLRHGVDAIVTGIGTVLADDPLLTDRSGLQRASAFAAGRDGQATANPGCFKAGEERR